MQQHPQVSREVSGVNPDSGVGAKVEVEPTSSGMVPAQGGTTVSTAPKGVPQEELVQLQDRARGLVTDLVANPDSRALIDGVSNLGIQAQRGAAQKLGLLNVRVGELTAGMKEVGGEEEANIPKQLTKLRVSLQRVNPHRIAQGGLLAWLPFVGQVIKNSGLEDKLRQLAAQYETVDGQVNGIVDSLRQGRTMLVRDNVELGEVLRPDIEAQQLVVRRNAYLAELIVQELEQAIAASTNAETRDKLQSILFDVIMRAQDLRTMEQVNLQMFASIDITIQNNRRLTQVIDRTLDIVVNLVRAGLGIQIALLRQRQVMTATQDTQEFASELLRQNAAAIRKGVQDVGKLYTSPVLVLDKVKAAHDDLIAAMDQIDVYKQEGIDAARQGIAQLSAMSTDLDERASKLHAKLANVKEPSSIEA